MVETKMAQFRFYSLNENDLKNCPSSIFIENTTSDGEKVRNCIWAVNLFEGYGNIVKVGIQTLPGVKFSFGSNFMGPDNKDIVVDYTGIYELDLRNVSVQINSLAFDADSLLLIHSRDNASIIVDIAYIVENKIKG